MPPLLVLLLSLGFIYWLLKQDAKLRHLPSKGIWIPIIWLAIFGSRPVSAWAIILGINVETSAQGNLVDSTIPLVLIFAAFVVLNKRNFKWSAFLGQNKLLVFIYAYLVCTSIWADDSLSTLKRAIKDLGSIPVALVLLTETKPLEAIRMVFVRLSYFILTLSVIFIKWFPHIGRRPDRGGSSLFCGVTTHKNTLGLVVFVFCLFVILDIFILLKANTNNRNKVHLRIRYGLIAMGLWLIDTCNSKTSLICLILGALIFWASKYVEKLGNPKTVIFSGALGLLVLMGIESELKISGLLMEAVGREPTLTGRTKIWELVKETDQRPLLGYGYFSYWDSKEAAYISEMWLGTLKSAHSGFLEMYLDSGFVGLVLLLLLIAQWAYRAITRCLDTSLKGRLCLAFLGVAILYNFSETSFFRAEPLWITLIILMLECPESTVKKPGSSEPSHPYPLHGTPIDI